MGLPLPGLGKLEAALLPDGVIAKQAEATEALAGAMIQMNLGNAKLAQAQFVLAESNNRLAQALTDAARTGVRV